MRSLASDDLSAIIDIDRDITGRDRSAYFKRKPADVQRSNGIRMSMVAEIDNTPAGVEKICTLIERDADLVLAFFRSQGMISSRYIQMEKEIG